MLVRRERPAQNTSASSSRSGRSSTPLGSFAERLYRLCRPKVARIVTATNPVGG